MKPKEIIIWIVVFVIGSLMVSFILSPNSFQNFKSNVKSVLPSVGNQDVLTNAKVEDPLITKCKQSFQICNEIVTKKYSGSLSLIKAEKFEEISKADEFYRTWSQPIGQMGLGYDLANCPGPISYCNQEGKMETLMPIVVLASVVIGPQGQAPYVFVCDNQGDLTKNSKSQYC